MELDLSETTVSTRQLAWWSLITLVIFTLGSVGYWLTPMTHDQAGVLTWSSWQLRQAQRVYRRELAALQQAADTLAMVVAAAPDPVQAQMLTERFVREFAEGEPALAHARTQLIEVSHTVQAFAIGHADRDTASQAVASLQTTLLDLQPAEPMEEPVEPVYRYRQHLPLTIRSLETQPAHDLAYP